MCPLCFLFSYKYHRTEIVRGKRWFQGYVVAYEPERVEWERRICGVCGSAKDRQRKAIRILNEEGS